MDTGEGQGITLTLYAVIASLQKTTSGESRKDKEILGKQRRSSVRGAVWRAEGSTTDEHPTANSFSRTALIQLSEGV